MAARLSDLMTRLKGGCGLKGHLTCLFLSLMLMAVVAAAQRLPNGVIFGLLSDKEAHLVAGAPIEVRNTATGMVYKVSSGPTGEYRMYGLPAGDYVVTVKIDNVGEYPQQPIKVSEAGPQRFDIILSLP